MKEVIARRSHTLKIAAILLLAFGGVYMLLSVLIFVGLIGEPEADQTRIGISLPSLLLGAMLFAFGLIALVRYLRTPPVMITYESGKFTFADGVQMDVGAVELVSYVSGRRGVSLIVQTKNGKYEYRNVENVVAAHDRMMSIVLGAARMKNEGGYHG